MLDPEPVPRPDLFTNGDADAWAEQYHLLRYVLRMSPERIAQIDYGLEDNHPEAWAAAGFWGAEIARTFPWVEARTMIERARRA